MGEPSGRNLTLAYASALAVVALMSLASHLTLAGVISEHAGAASVINVAGRQRMLSQRIAGLVAERELGLPVEADLVRSVDQFEHVHRTLVDGDPRQHLKPATDPALRAIYFEGAQPLDAAMAEFVARARRIVAAPPGDAQRRRDATELFAEAREPILTKLDDVVSVHQAMSEAQLRSLEWMQAVSLGVVIVTLLIEALLIFRPMVRRIARHTQALMRMASTDPLTGALNRRSFAERAGAELSRADRYGRTTGLLMLDADRFKAVNDRYGHAGGDAVLRAFATAVKDALRPADLVGRLGGEEFAVLLPETGIGGAEAAAERIRAAIEALDVASDGQVIRFTVSIGAVEVGRGPEALQGALDRADAALYRAKDLGRNRVVVGTAPPTVAGRAATATLAAA